MKTRTTNIIELINDENQSHHDILLSLIFRLDLQQIVLLWFIAKNAFPNTNLMKGVLSDNSFWAKHANYHLKTNNSYNYDEIEIYKKNTARNLRNYYSYNIIKSSLKNSRYLTPSLLSIFNTERTYSSPSSSISFKITDIENCLIKDDAVGLFDKLAATLSNELPHLIGNDDFYYNQHNCTWHFKSYARVYPDKISFIFLLPAIIKMKAENCFKYFLSTYIKLLVSNDTNIRQEYNQEYLLHNIVTLIEKMKDEFFIKQCYTLIIKLLPPEGNIHKPIDINDHQARDIKSIEILCFVIKRALVHKYDDVLLESFACIKKGKIDFILDKCEKYSISKIALLPFLSANYNHKLLLNNVLSNTMKDMLLFNENGNSKNCIQQLLEMRSRIDSVFTNWIDELQNEKTNTNSNNISTFNK